MNRAARPPDPFASLPAEIGPGLVLHLDPDALEREGGTFTCSPEVRVQGMHFFLCVWHERQTGAGMGRWLPLYSRPGDHRVLLPAEGRTGHTKWIGGQFYWHEWQVWTASDRAIIVAAIGGEERSRPGRRNRLDPRFLPVLDPGQN